jgi:hypothetical protein
MQQLSTVVYMDVNNLEFLRLFLNKCEIKFEHFDSLESMMIPRDILLQNDVYNRIKTEIPTLKKILSSSHKTCLHKTAETNQKWPLINIVRQILTHCNFKLTPIRKSDGRDKTGKKLYKRYFLIEKYKIID